jgi:hypothetical protein
LGREDSQKYTCFDGKTPHGNLLQFASKTKRVFKA